MSDLLVKLYDLPNEPASALTGSYQVIRPLAPDKRRVVDWVTQHFSDRWASETELAFSGHPITCFVAVDDQQNIVGFACYNTTYLGFFGPIGVAETDRGRGLGTALLLRSLQAMQEAGFAYGVIGHVKDIGYYQSTVGAIEIEDSTPGAYRNLIKG